VIVLAHLAWRAIQLSHSLAVQLCLLLRSPMAAKNGYVNVLNHRLHQSDEVGVARKKPLSASGAELRH
jgi:hypothetical protein